MSKLSQIKQVAYWMDPHPMQKSYSDKNLGPKTDVVVIGSGYTGVVAALQLKKAGMAVTLLEKEKIGSEASAKNGGMSLTGLSFNLYKSMKKHGKEKMKRFFDESVASIDRVEELVEAGNIDCDFKRDGHLEAAFKPAHFEGLKEDQAFLAEEVNHTTHLVEKNHMRDEIGSDLYHGGLVDPMSAGVHPAKYIAGLIRMADDAGVDLHEHLAAKEICKTNGRFTIRTDRGDISAAHVVVATNGYTTALTPWQMRRVVPVESFMIATEELPPEVAKPLVPKNRMISDTKRFLYYFRLSPDGKRMLFGGRLKRQNASTLEKAAEMHANLLHVYPQLESYNIDYAWFGKVCFTVDRFPIIGRRDGIHYAMGYCGHGVAMATHFGFKLAEMILGQGEESAFMHHKSIPIPFYRGKPWFLPVAHMYFRFLDVVR